MGTISARYFRSFYMSCQDNGCPAIVLEGVVPGAPAIFSDPTKRFDQTLLLDMLHAAEHATGNEATGLLAGTAFRPATFLDIGYGLIACQNIREAMAFNAKYQRLTQEIGTTNLETDGPVTRVMWCPTADAPNNDPAHLRPFTEAVFAGYAGLGRWLSWQYDAKIIRLHFRHNAPANLDLYQQIFACPIHFDSENDYMELETMFVEKTLPQPNAALLQHLSMRLDEQLAGLNQPVTITSQVRSCIQQILSDTPDRKTTPSVNNVAAALGTSDRSLRRHLASHGTSFRLELAKARQEACEIYLKENRWSTMEMAQMLGYSEQSAFSRAFKTWFGIPPSQYKSEPGA